MAKSKTFFNKASYVQRNIDVSRTVHSDFSFNSSDKHLDEMTKQNDNKIGLKLDVLSFNQVFNCSDDMEIVYTLRTGATFSCTLQNAKYSAKSLFRTLAKTFRLHGSHDSPAISWKFEDDSDEQKGEWTFKPKNLSRHNGLLRCMDK